MDHKNLERLIYFSRKICSLDYGFPLEKNYQFSLNRKTKEIKKSKFYFEGPVWYVKSLNDNHYLAASSVEKGNGVLSNDACIYLSKDLTNWEVLVRFKKDIFPMPLFKWGVATFQMENKTLVNLHYILKVYLVWMVNLTYVH